MKKSLLIIIMFMAINSFGQTATEPRTIHVFVALCDNVNQGIVPVPALIGNGQDPKNNLYWGALYGVKTFFKKTSATWIYQATIKSEASEILESILFEHKTKNIYLLADAYDGAKIKKCTEDFLLASNTNFTRNITHNEQNIKFGGASDLVSYVGHDGLMEFDVNLNYQPMPAKRVDAIILACASQDYFEGEIVKSKATPVLWTTNLMAPEAYTLEAALNAWSDRKTAFEIKEQAAQAYHQYQKCGINGARRLFATGFE
ncbi:MAG: hypothetical protein AAFQ94_00340 [Bacteroidota bacterium]